jgi:hypothetical protein
MRTLRAGVPLLVAVAAAGCGGSSSSPKFPTIRAARTFELVDFVPSRPASSPTTVSFVIRQPNGRPLTSFRRGGGPHTGVHLIFVRSDLAYIVHRHPPIAGDGTIRDRIVFPAPGPYRVVVDAYPATSGPQRNFQLFRILRIAGSYTRQKLPPFRSVATVAGYRFAIERPPRLRAIEATSMTIRVTAPNGRPARFTPWYGALAHAIFFRRGTLDYFHTHVCAPGATGCTSVLGGARVSGSSAEPGKLTVGVLVPAPGEWRLFLQCRVDGRVLTAPFTLEVR